MKTKPWAHQQKELDDHSHQPARALLWQQRTGKTKTIIDTLGLWPDLRSVIIIAPNGVHKNWVDRELPTHADYQYSALAWDTRRCRTRAYLARSTDLQDTPFLAVLSIGKESILSPKVQDFIKKILKRGPCGLVVDESHHFGKPGVKRTRAVRGLAKKCVFKRILTGTPTGNSPLRLFSQFEILQPGALGYTTHKGFQDRYAVMGTGYARNRTYPVIEGYKNEDELQARVAEWSSVILRKDCNDLPEILVSKHAYEPSAKQRQIYDSMKKRYIAELEGGSITAIDAAPRLIRLQQILSNFLDIEGKIENIDPANNPRMDALRESIDGPSIIWCRFREEINRIKKNLKEFRIVEYHGGIDLDNRQKSLADFQMGKADIFLGSPFAAGEGLDLSRANNIIWYSHTFDVIVRDQANERATKMGRKSINIIDLEAPGTIDTYILENLDKKQSIAAHLTGEGLQQLLKTF